MYVINLFMFLCVLEYCAADCQTSIKNDHKNILLLKNGNILLPYDNVGTIKVPDNDIIQMACISNPVLPMNKQNVVSATCKGGDRYEVDSRIYQAKQLTCKSTPPPTEKLDGKCLNNQYENVNIGFEVGNNFIQQINLCFDDAKKVTLYTQAILSKRLCCCQTDSNRPTFRVGLFYTSAMQEKYTKANQMRTLEDILSGGRTLPPYIQTDNELQKGHLVAKCDFVYDVQQKMTFYLSNAAPQWKSFNIGNWKQLEAKVRALVAEKQCDLHVFTGTYGILKLNNSFGGKSEIYLNYNPRQGIRQMPVPQYFWKVLVSMDTSHGLAIIGMNNIYEFEPDPCTNIISRIKWLEGGAWQSRRSGYTIACEVNEFKNIPGLRDQLPQIPATRGILNTTDCRHPL